jgi:hypothetical protein
MEFEAKKALLHGLSLLPLRMVSSFEDAITFPQK